MPMLVWRDEFKTGIPAIDHEHRNLINVINLLLSDAREGEAAGRQLGEIHALIEAHFALEEHIMRATGFANFAAHKADHDRLLEEIRDIMEDGDRASVLQDRLTNWFGNHFRTLDRELHAMVYGLNKSAGGVPEI